MGEERWPADKPTPRLAVHEGTALRPGSPAASTASESTASGPAATATEIARSYPVGATLRGYRTSPGYSTSAGPARVYFA